MSKLLLALLFFTLLSGCAKEEEPQLTSKGTWLLTDASLYIKRWGDYPVKRYAYFKQGQEENCMDLNGNCLELDIIHRNVTKWEILGDRSGGFILNDTLVYEMQSSAWAMRIFPTENGSARIFILDSLEADYVRWSTSDREQALTFEGVTDNFTYYSKLEFKRIK